MRRNYIFLALDNKTKEIKEINSVENGLDCNCVCCVCNTPLEARQGNHNIWHFAHTKINAGQNCFDGAVELIKKYIINKLTVFQDEIKLPMIDINFLLINKNINKILTINNESMTVNLICELPDEFDVNIIFDDNVYLNFKKASILDHEVYDVFGYKPESGFLVVSIEAILKKYIKQFHSIQICSPSFVEFAIDSFLYEDYCKRWMYIPVPKRAPENYFINI
ncbi:hypothetical protein KG383_005392 [Salmonella enterica subsp. enterica serovar Newport]|nr:hypothetical protein [Salmonella enterica subsp. enterica serovar Newport]